MKNYGVVPERKAHLEPDCVEKCGLQTLHLNQCLQNFAFQILKYIFLSFFNSTWTDHKQNTQFVRSTFKMILKKHTNEIKGALDHWPFIRDKKTFSFYELWFIHSCIDGRRPTSIDVSLLRARGVWACHGVKHAQKTSVDPDDAGSDLTNLDDAIGLARKRLY